jgi:two-component system, NarL family, nitrate/nitrite response regulator NarL
MTEREKIKVLLVDNHPLVIEGLKSVLETYDHIAIVGTAHLARQGLELAVSARPAVVLMDINMPLLNGIDAIDLFRRHVPEARILMLSMHDSREYISAAVLLGAAGYVLKDVATEEIVNAIETVAAGGTYFSSGVPEVLLKRRESGDAPLVPLTSREREILTLLASGKSNKDIASQLAISASTVETHRKSIKKKLGIATTAGLTRFAIERGLDAEDEVIPRNG